MFSDKGTVNKDINDKIRFDNRIMHRNRCCVCDCKLLTKEEELGLICGECDAEYRDYSTKGE